MTLTTDEEYAARLRTSMRLDELHSDARPEQVLVASRRAQRRRALRTSAVVLCGVLAVGFAGPALVQEVRRAAEAPSATQPEDVEVVIDTTDGTITLPLDRYFLTETEQAEVLHASALAMHECAADRGYVISDAASMALLTPSTEPNPIGDRRFGVWWMPSAETYGYATWSTPGNDYGVADALWGEARTDEQWEILDECGRTPTVQQFWPDAELGEPTPDFQKRALDSGAGQAAVRDWDACLATHGLHETGGWGVTDGTRNSGDTPADNGEPLGPDSAVIDAQCKADVDLVERLTQMVADRQAPFIAAHRSELTVIRIALDESLRRARAYIAEHG
ncbi:hypothetical protein HP550_16165 [Cellulomonas humilata]|uniref:Uncharacterized protein n=1 Tax=Cellulomonas humilata TaxID=144055 RepID=A0A7Y6DYM3_9CELL|nr:hypothetical protein [Cellulomonas humilata]NUU18788.1 hypothetical protein [Cellulomonas humilata]